MFKKLLISAAALLLIVSAVYAGGSNTLVGYVSGDQTPATSVFYVVNSPSDTGGGACIYDGGTTRTFGTDDVGNFYPLWADGQRAIFYIEKGSHGSAQYAVAGLNLDIAAAFQEFPVATMRAVPGTTATADAPNGEVDLSWSAAQTGTSADIAGYRIYRSSGGAYASIGTVSGRTTTTFSDTTGTAGTSYTYAILIRYRGGVDSAYRGAPSAAVVYPDPPVADPRLSVSPASRTFNAQVGGANPATQTVTVRNSGGGTLNWSASESLAWLSIAPASGSRGAGASTAVTLTVDIAGMAEGTYEGDIDFTSTGGAGSATVSVTLNLTEEPPPPGDGPNITSITSGGEGDDNIYVGETIVINGTDFEEYAAASTVTVGGVAANVTEWTDARITLSVPAGVSAGSADVVVTNASGSDSNSITVVGGGVVIDDIERGPVGSWAFDYDADGSNDSGYYGMGTGIDPAPGDGFGDNAVQATAAQHGAYGIRIQYSHAGGWGGGFGGQLSNALDITGHDTLSFYIAWDGSSNEIKFAFRDSAGHISAATVSNTTLASGTGYKRIAVPMSAFSEDVDNADRTPGAIDMTDITGYEVVYTTDGTSTGYQHIDSIAVGTVNWGGDDPPEISGEVVVDRIEPARGPAGTKFTAFGNGFGDSQGSSILIFENSETRTNYEVEILTWGDTSIEAIVPKLAPIGDYTVKVIRIAISAGSLSAFESTPHAYEVTNNLTSSGVATVFPNPFNPLEASVPVSRASGMSGATATIAYNATGITNIGIYIYDTTAKLVFHETTTESQVGWNGTDMNGNHVADGVYILRVVNEETKSLISKGKILVVKQR